jgi:serine/threonine-protein kinase
MGNTLADAVERRRHLPDCDGLPSGLVPLFQRMLAPDPAVRIRSMAEVLSFLDALAPTAAVFEPSAQPVSRPPGKPVRPKSPIVRPKPASAPKRRRGKAKWALAALPIAGGALWLAAAPASRKPMAPAPPGDVKRTAPQAPSLPLAVPTKPHPPFAKAEAPATVTAPIATPTATPMPTATPIVVPTAKPSPDGALAAVPVRKPYDDAGAHLVDLQKLERSHHGQSSGVGACYRFVGDWKLIGYTSKAACALTVFFNQCQVKNGLFDRTALRRNGPDIEEMRGRKWQAIYRDRRCA